MCCIRDAVKDEALVCGLRGWSSGVKGMAIAGGWLLLEVLGISWIQV
jgi:hypothetical protein